LQIIQVVKINAKAPNSSVDVERATVLRGEEPPRHSRLEIFERVAEACLDLPVRLIEASLLYEDLLGHVPLGQSTSAWFQYLLHPRYRAGSPFSTRFRLSTCGWFSRTTAHPVMGLWS